MPPVNQGSKAALITWTVVATVIGITCLVLALIFYVGRNDAEQRYQTLQRSYQEVATEADLTSPRVTDLVRQAKEEGGATAMTHLQIREETLANVAAGTTEYQQALARAEQLLSQLQGEPTNVQANSLTGAVEQLRTRVTELTQQSQRLTQTNQVLEQALAQARDNFTQQVETLQAQNEQTMQQLQEQQAIASGRTEAMDQLAQTTAQQIQEVTTLGGQENQTREQRIQELSESLGLR